jgi:xylulokinase
VALWLGLDFGTSAAKALLVDESGTVRARAATAYGTSRGGEGVAEQDPDVYLAAAEELIGACSPAGAADGVGLCGQTPTLVFVGEDGRSVRPAITWQDVRARAETARLQRAFGDPQPLFGINLPWSPVYPPAKLRWIADHEPATVRRTRLLLQPKDLVGMALTGSGVSDLWSCRGLRNLADGTPVSPVLQAAGWPDSVVPEAAPAWASRGPVTEEAADRFGLRPGIPVSVGWTDALGGLLAVGAFDEPRAFVISGTADIVGRSVGEPPADASPLLLIPRTCAPLPVVYGPVQSTGAAISWLGGLLAERAAAVDAGDGAAAVHAGNGAAGADAGDEQLAAVASAGAPVFLPYLAGERAPIWRDDVRGMFVGLALEHGARELVRAAELGVACADRDVMETADVMFGGRSADVRVAGATAAGERWRRLRAAVLGRPIEVLREPEASALGAAMLAACAAGASIDDVGRQMRGPVDRLEPSATGVRLGEVAFRRYRRARDIALAWADGERSEAETVEETRPD